MGQAVFKRIQFVCCYIRACVSPMAKCHTAGTQLTATSTNVSQTWINESTESEKAWERID